MRGARRPARALAANPNSHHVRAGDAPHARSMHGSAGVNVERKHAILTVLNESDVPLTMAEIHVRLTVETRLDKMGTLVGELVEEGVVIRLGGRLHARFTVAL